MDTVNKATTAKELANHVIQRMLLADIVAYATERLATHYNNNPQQLADDIDAMIGQEIETL